MTAVTKGFSRQESPERNSIRARARACMCVTNEHIKFCSLSRSSFPAVDVSISEKEEKGLKVVD